MPVEISSVDVAALVVTYGDRFSFLRETLDSIVKNGISEIYCVFNGCSPEKTDEFLKNYSGSINLIPIMFKQNTGSAGGFGAGLEKFRSDSSKNFLWILDDDNVADRTALSNLLVYKKGFDDKEILCSNRVKFKIFEQYDSGTSVSVLYPQNSSFLGLSILTILPTALRFFRKRFIRSKNTFEVTQSPLIQISQSPWGGMLIPKNLLKNDVIPDKDMHLYADDTAFSVKAAQFGYRLIMVRGSVVTDIDASFHLHNSNSNRFSKWLLSEPYYKVNYSIRNNAYIDKNIRRSNSGLYYINKYIFLLILLGFSIKHKRMDRFFHLIKCIKDGESGNLGIML